MNEISDRLNLYWCIQIAWCDLALKHIQYVMQVVGVVVVFLLATHLIPDLKLVIAILPGVTSFCYLSTV